MCCKGLKKYGAINTKLKNHPLNADKYLSGQIFLAYLEFEGSFFINKALELKPNKSQLSQGILSNSPDICDQRLHVVLRFRIFDYIVQG
jgi:hypothetical protein